MSLDTLPVGQIKPSFHWTHCELLDGKEREREKRERGVCVCVCGGGGGPRFPRGMAHQAAIATSTSPFHGRVAASDPPLS